MLPGQRQLQDGMIGKHWKKKSGTPQLLDFKIKTKEDWLKNKELLRPSLKRLNVSHWGEYEVGGSAYMAVDEPWKKKFKRYERADKEEKFIWLNCLAPYECIWPKVGPGRLLWKVLI